MKTIRFKSVSTNGNPHGALLFCVCENGTATAYKTRASLQPRTPGDGGYISEAIYRMKGAKSNHKPFDFIYTVKAWGSEVKAL